MNFFFAASNLSRQPSIQAVSKKVLNELLKPRSWMRPPDRKFLLEPKEINDLCESAEAIFAQESSVLQVRAPVKIFGDLHGQFGDLMRIFDEFVLRLLCLPSIDY